MALLKTKTWQESGSSVLAKDSLSSSKEGVFGRRGHCNVGQNLHGDVRFLPGCRFKHVQTTGGAAIDNVGSRVEAENAGRLAIAIYKSPIANEGRR